jgi:Icc-related predicted phosphoesterase
MRIAAVGDLHCRADTRRNIAVALGGADEDAEVLLIAGDLTDHGTIDEAAWLADELGQIKMAKVAVLGNPTTRQGRRTPFARCSPRRACTSSTATRGR